MHGGGGYSYEDNDELPVHFNQQPPVISRLHVTLPPDQPQLPLELHIAISYVDAAGAKRNFETEHTTWPRLKRRARKAWEEAMSVVEVKHHSKRDAIVFDTALYHTLVAPYVHSDADGRFLGPDGGVHTAKGFTYYSFLSTWDTYRACTSQSQPAPTHNSSPQFPTLQALQYTSPLATAALALSSTAPPALLILPGFWAPGKSLHVVRGSTDVSTDAIDDARPRAYVPTAPFHRWCFAAMDIRRAGYALHAGHPQHDSDVAGRRSWADHARTG